MRLNKIAMNNNPSNSDIAANAADWREAGRIISVIGAGTMGNGIAHVFAQAGFKTSLIDVNSGQLEKALATIGKNLDRQIAKGTINEEQKRAALNNINTFREIPQGVQNAALVVEAASENITLKLNLFKQL